MNKENENKLDEEQKSVCRQLESRHMDTLLSASEAYNKAIITLSLAALGYTFLFIDHIGHSIKYPWLLWLSWLSLIISIACILASFVADQAVSQRRIKWYGDMADTGISKADQTTCADCIMVHFPIFSGVGFLIAIILFTILVFNNIAVI